MSSVKRAALGARAHSGWAAVVAVAQSDGTPVVIDRRRIELATRAVPGFPQPYHAAEKLSLNRAEKLVDDCIEAARRQGHEAFGELAADLSARGYAVTACGILAGSGR